MLALVVGVMLAGDPCDAGIEVKPSATSLDRNSLRRQAIETGQRLQATATAIDEQGSAKDGLSLR